MAEKSTICLVGPKKSGKSALLAAATDAIVQGAHGYPAELAPALTPIGRGDFDQIAAVAARLGLLDDTAEDYERLRRQFAETDEPGEQLAPVEHHFRLTLSGAAVSGAPAPSALLRVVDASGDIALPETAVPPGAMREARDKFAARLGEARAIVLVPPLLRAAESGWPAGMARLIERLGQAPGQRLQRVMVVFSQYDRLFVRLGPAAFTYACDPAVALHALRRQLGASNWIAGLRALEANGVEVRFTVASAFGFTKTFQNPNVDPQQKGERRFRRDSVAGAAAVTEFWRPFLAADPLVWSASGFSSGYMFSLAQLNAGGFPRRAAGAEVRTATGDTDNPWPPTL